MIESLGRAAAETVAGLKAQPLVLAQVVLNALFIGLVVFLLHQISAAGQRRDATVRELIGSCFDQLRGDKHANDLHLGGALGEMPRSGGAD